MSDRVLIVAPTLHEARGEADELGVPARQVILASNGNPYALRGVSVAANDIVRVRENGWSDELRSMVDAVSVGAEPGVQV